MSNRTYGAFACPKCGNLADEPYGIHRCWYVARTQRVVGTYHDKVVHKEHTEESDLPAKEEREHFYCEKCKNEWPAQGVKFVVPYEVEQEQRRQERFAELQNTHVALLLFPNQFKPGDVLLRLNQLVTLVSNETSNDTVAGFCRWILSDHWWVEYPVEVPVMVWRKKESSNANPA